MCICFLIIVFIILKWIYSKLQAQKYYNLVNIDLKYNNLDLWNNQDLSNNVIKYKGFENAKIILYADSVYGMENWGIGFENFPFETQGIHSCKF